MSDLRDFTGKNRKFTGTIGKRISVGTTAERDTATFGSGTLRFNSNNNLLEYYDGSAWREVRDLNNVITTQGDVLYRDGSGLARLAAGTSGQFLKTNGSGANPAWATVSSGLVQTVEQSYRTGFTQTLTTSTFTPLNNGTTDMQVQITPTSASNKILIWCMLGYFSPHTASTVYGASALIQRKIGAGSFVDTFDRADQIGSNRPRGLFSVPQVNYDMYNPGFTFVSYDSTYSSTSQLTYRICVNPHSSGSRSAVIGYPTNHSDNNEGYAASAVVRLIAQEIA